MHPGAVQIEETYMAYSDTHSELETSTPEEEVAVEDVFVDEGIKP
jgi:hypothetical protein